MGITPNELMARFSSDLNNVITPSTIASTSITISPDETEYNNILDYGLRNNIGLNYNSVQNIGTELNCIVDCGAGILIAGTTGSIYKSMDYGETWRYIKNLDSETSILSLSFVGNEVLLAGSYPNARIFKSTDMGESWSTGVEPGTNTKINCIKNCGEGIILAGSSGLVYKSTDNGGTWSTGQQLGSETDINTISFAGSNIVMAGTSPNGKVYLSNNLGDTWEDIGQVLVTNNNIKSSAYCGSGLFIACGSTNATIIYSTDYGQTWSEGETLTGETDLTSILYLGKGIALAGSASGKVWRSKNKGINGWENVSTLAYSTNIKTISVSQEFDIINLGCNGYAFRSTDVKKPLPDFSLINNSLLSSI